MKKVYYYSSKNKKIYFIDPSEESPTKNMPKLIPKRGPSSWIKDDDDNTWLAAGIALAQNGIQFILENFNHSCFALLHKNNQSSSSTVILLEEHLRYSRSFLEKLQQNLISPFPLSILGDLIAGLIKKLEPILSYTDSCVHRNVVPEKKQIDQLDQYCKGIDDLVKRMRTIEQKEINVASLAAPATAPPPPPAAEESSSFSSHKNSSTMIGFDDERQELLDKLVSKTAGGRKVISIIGMGGIGKTTLAQTLFNDPRVVYHFHIRAWNFFPQEYDKRKSLSNILSYIIDGKDPVFNSKDDDNESVGEKLYKSLKGRRYLIVIDDIWDIKQWEDIKMYFPEDNTSSRILLTSRIEDIALKIAPEISPHFLRFLTPEESWDLFESLVFLENKNGVLEELTRLGKRIVERCQGLPLAICVVAGILVKEDKTEQQWRHIANNIGKLRETKTPNDFSDHYMDILELSYKHLPRMLQSCFLYLGTYSDDTSIPVKKLLLSWIAEGLVAIQQQQNNTDQNLENAAEDCLKELIQRSLVIVMEKRSDGGVKLIRIHDLLRDLCHTKVKEKKFLQPICECGAICFQYSFLTLGIPVIAHPYRQCRPYFHFHRSSFYAPGRKVFSEESFSIYRFLRRLELKNVVLLDLPEEISFLFHLRYLELQVDHVTSHLSSVFKLWNLETCILYVEKGGRIEVPYEFWKMLKLRHLEISQELVFSDPQCFPETIRPTLLENLQTISQLCPSGSVKDVLSRTPNLRKLGIHMSLSVSNEHFDCFPNLAHLDLLQKIKFEYQTLGIVPMTVIPHLELHKFPPNLKKLTLSGIHLQWEEMSIISVLPKLEILKLKNNFFSGPVWETSDDGFCHLKFLKLSNMDLQKWISSSDHFPKLECLVLNGCLDLEEIPLEIGDIPTLQTIKVYGSSKSAMESANQIQESQNLIGNDDLKVFISHQFEEY